MCSTSWVMKNEKVKDEDIHKIKKIGVIVKIFSLK